MAMESSLPKAPFPAPPLFWKHFTTSNLQKLKELDSSSTPSTTSPLPLELTYLRPPPPPPPNTKTYPTFSQPNFTTITPILPPPETLLFNPSSHAPPAILLTRLTKSLLLNFLELITILSESPEDYAEKIEDIRTIVVNVHAVLNMYRPHQAREEVRVMLEGMLEQGKREMEEGERVRAEVEGFLKGLEGWKVKSKEANDGGLEDKGKKGAIEITGSAKGKNEKEKGEGETNFLSQKQLDEARRLWKLIDEIGEG